MLHVNTIERRIPQLYTKDAVNMQIFHSELTSRFPYHSQSEQVSTRMSLKKREALPGLEEI